MAHNILGIDTYMTYSSPINKAFVLTDNDLQHFFNEGKNWVGEPMNGEPTVRCSFISRETKENIVSNTLQKIIDYNNPSRDKIRAISLEMVSKDKSRTFGLDFQDREWPQLITLTVGGNSQPEMDNISRKIEADIHDITQWYWFLTTRKWVAKLLTWLFWICLTISILSTGLTIISSARNWFETKKVNETIQHIQTDAPVPKKTTKPKTIEEIPTKPMQRQTKPWEELWKLARSKRVWGGVLIVLVVISLERISVYLFPKAIFAIGKGKQRYAKLKSVRKWAGGIITTIIILGIIVPLVQRLIWKSP